MHLERKILAEVPSCDKLSTQNDLTSEIAIHFKFLQSVSQLHASSKRLTGLPALDLATTVKDTVIRATEAIAECLHCAVRRSLPSITSFQMPVNIIAIILGSPYLAQFQEQLVKTAIGLVREILSIIIHCDAFSTEEDVHCILSSMLLTLAGLPVLTKWVLAELLSTISTHSDHLRELSNTTDEMSKFSVVEYENMCHVFRMLEEIIVKSGVISDQKVCDEMKKLLADSLLHISQAFPLFAHYVWRLGAIISTRHQY
jgi:hypothetical protein